MKVLFLVFCLMAVAMARPQILRPWPSAIGSPVWPHTPSTSVVMARHGLWPYTTQAASALPVVVRYPSQDTSRGLPQPVEDTPEVRAAKMAFAAEYEKAAVAAALAPAAEGMGEGSTLVLLQDPDTKIVPAVLKESKADMGSEMPATPKEDEMDTKVRTRREPKEPVMYAEKKMMLITPASTHRMGMSLDMSNLMHHSVIPVPVPLPSVQSMYPMVALPGKSAGEAPEGAYYVHNARPVFYNSAGVPLVLVNNKERMG